MGEGGKWGYAVSRNAHNAFCGPENGGQCFGHSLKMYNNYVDDSPRARCSAVPLSVANLLLFLTRIPVSFAPSKFCPLHHRSMQFLKMGDSPNTPAVSTLSHLAEGPLAARGVDIYFIARPSGNADGAWTTNENPTSHWLRDWLPADLPSTRILTYGYSASPDYDWNIPKIADQLLTDLIGLRSGKLEVRSCDIWFLPFQFEFCVLKCDGVVRDTYHGLSYSSVKVLVALL